MKSLLAAGLVLLSFSSLASEIIKLQDGSVAVCESKVDVARHTFSSVYRPLEYKQDGATGYIKIEFLRCMEDKNGKFSFKRDTDLGVRTINPVLNPNQTLELTRSKLMVTVTNGKSAVVDRQELTLVQDGIYTATFSVVSSEYDPSPAGKKSLLIHVQSLRKIIDLDTAEVLDQGLEHLGAYRIVIK